MEARFLRDELRAQLAAQLAAFRALSSGATPPLSSFRAMGNFAGVGTMPVSASASATVAPDERADLLMRAAALQRLQQLRALRVGDASLANVLEAKSLEALPLQKRARDALVSELRKTVALASASDPESMRLPLVDSGKSTQDEARVKQRRFLAAVVTNARAFQTMRYNKVKTGKELQLQLLKLNESSEKRKKADEERQARERVQMLRQGDEEGYLRMLKNKKNARLEMLLQQTADFMNKIASMVQLEKDRAFVEETRGLARDRRAAEEEQKREEELERQRLLEEQEREKLEREKSEEFDSEDKEKDKKDEGEEKNVKEAEAVVAMAPVQEAPRKDYATTNQSYMASTHTVQESVALQPKMLKFGTLREYQLKGLQWLVSLYNNNLNGILADEMGLGKTIQTISLLAYLMETKKNMGPFLIIVPLSTLSNWKDEFERWTPEIQLVVYNGAPGVRNDLWNDKLRSGKFNVLLTTFDFVVRDKARLSTISWNFLIIDEGHRIKNSNSVLAVTLSKSYRPKHRLLLTGTPLQNSLPELWSLLNFLLPKIFNSVESFEDWFNSPFATSGDKVEMTEEESLLIIRRLHVVLRPFLLRRLKKEVEKQLPDKMEKVLRCPMSEWQKLLYDRMLSDRTVMTEGGVRGLQNKLMQLRKICNHPYLFDEKTGYDIDEKMIRVAGKFALLDHVLPKLKAAGHRVLIFSQMTSLMDILGYFFQIRGYQYLRLDGATKQDDRRESMAKWNAKDSPYFVFVLSTRAGGLGLNLQTADTVVLFDSDWNPQADLQAQDRAHRIGQTKRVLVLRLITAHTIEERILETATRKLDMDQKVIGAGGFSNANADDPSQRRAILEQLLKDNSTRDGAEVHTLKEINQRMARSEEEYRLFKRMDEERLRERERRAVAGEKVLPEMVGLDELPAWLTAPPAPVDPEKAKFKDLDGVVSDAFGRGKRRKAEVEYTDQLDEDEFCMLMERGATEAEIKAYIAERNARGEGGEGGGEDDAEDGDHVVLPEDEGQLPGDNIPRRPRNAKANASRALDPTEAALQSRGIALLEALRALRDPSSGRAFADNWRVLHGPDGPPEQRKRGRPSTADKPVDLTDVGNKLKKLRYKSFEQIVADLERMFAHLLSVLPEGSSERAEAMEGLKKLHAISDEPQPRIDAAEEEEAAAILAGGVTNEGAEAPAKKLKLKLPAAAKE